MDIPHIQERVCRALSPKDVYHCTLVCRSWHENLSKYLWRVISLISAKSLRRFLQSPQTKDIASVVYLIERIVCPYPKIFPLFHFTSVARNLKYKVPKTKDDPDGAPQSTHEDVVMDLSGEELIYLYGEAPYQHRPFNMMISAYQFSRLTELRFPSLLCSQSPPNHYIKRRQVLPDLFRIIQQAPNLKVLELGSLHLDTATVSWITPIIHQHPSLKELRLISRGQIRTSDIRKVLWSTISLKKFTWLGDPDEKPYGVRDAELVEEETNQYLQANYPGSAPDSVSSFYYNQLYGSQYHTEEALQSCHLEELDLRSAPIPFDNDGSFLFPFLRGYCPKLKRLVYPFIRWTFRNSFTSDIYLSGLPMVLTFGMPVCSHLDFRNVNHSSDDMMECLIQDSNLALETFIAPGGSNAFGRDACNALIRYHHRWLREVSFAKCSISAYHMSRILRSIPQLERFRTLMYDLEQDQDGASGYYSSETHCHDPVIQFQYSGWLRVDDETMAKINAQMKEPWACKGLKTLSLRFYPESYQEPFSKELLDHIAELTELEELMLEQACEFEKDSKSDHEEETLDPNATSRHHHATTFASFVGLKKLKRFTVINVDQEVMREKALALQELLPQMEPVCYTYVTRSSSDDIEFIQVGDFDDDGEDEDFAGDEDEYFDGDEYGGFEFDPYTYEEYDEQYDFYDEQHGYYGEQHDDHGEHIVELEN
ncbi:hypothetical protein BG004_005871 [Podila humilis]|nr:hypothetical protein BG004_005871 [Podila humilis]